jgi:hypothetical protein
VPKLTLDPARFVGGAQQRLQLGQVAELDVVDPALRASRANRVARVRLDGEDVEAHAAAAVARLGTRRLCPFMQSSSRAKRIGPIVQGGTAIGPSTAESTRFELLTDLTAV